MARSQRSRKGQPEGRWISDGVMPEDRPLALSWGSRLILERLGVWQEVRELVEEVTVAPEKHLHLRMAGGERIMSEQVIQGWGE